MKTKHVSTFVPSLILALALGSGCSTFHGYETSLPPETQPVADVGGPYRIVEMTNQRVAMDGTALPGTPETSCPGSAMTRYLAEKFPGTFSADESSTPLVVRQTIAHGNMESNAGQAFVASFLTLGFTPSKSCFRKQMTTAFLLPNEETTDPFSWEVQINHLYNVNPIGALAFSKDDGWYPGAPLEVSMTAGVTGSRDPVIAADYTADKEFADKVLDGTATDADHEAMNERMFWQQVSQEVGTARWREYAGAAIVEALNRLTSEERAALKNNLAARTAGGDASLLEGLFSDYPIRKAIAPLGRDALIGTWEGEAETETLNSGFPKGGSVNIPPRKSERIRFIYEFQPDGTLLTSSVVNDSAKRESKGTWTYADGKLTTEFPLPMSEKTFVSTEQVAWFGPDEFEIRQIAGTKQQSHGTIKTTIEENGVYTMVSTFGGMKTVMRGTPVAFQRKK